LEYLTFVKTRKNVQGRTTMEIKDFCIWKDRLGLFNPWKRRGRRIL